MSIITKLFQNLQTTKIIRNYINDHKDELTVIDGENLLKLQKCLLFILKDFDSFCERNGLRYSITGGTLLGKIRHNGFIPWDDDFDIIMPREDYDKLKQIYDSSNDDFCQKYTFRGPGYSKGAIVRIGKIYKNDSVLESILSKDNTINKVFIDIFPIDYVPDNRIVRLFRGYLSFVLIVIISCVERKKNITNDFNLNLGVLYKISSAVRLFFGTIFSVYPLKKLYDLLDNITKNTKFNKETKQITAATGALLYFGEIIPAEIYFPLQRTDFCGISTWMPNQPEKYLENRYGDWKRIPEPKDREIHYVRKLDIGKIE